MKIFTKRDGRIKYQHTKPSLRYDLMSMSADEIEGSGIYIERIFITKFLFDKIYSFYNEKDFFWRKKEESVRESGSRCIGHFGLSFCLMETIDEAEGSSYYKIQFYKPGNAPELMQPFQLFYEPGEYDKISRLQGLGINYFDIYRLLSSIFLKYSNEIMSIDLWDKFEYYCVYQNNRLTSRQKENFIRKDQGLPSIEEENLDYSFPYSVFSDGDGGAAYVGDGIWASSSGNMTDEGR
ncbi:hypothetical protein ACQE32_06940 [Pantoea sp. FN0302]|uniref:hypothetical protein n=1 Tax=Pantoea sp. FN0302 TaxID=3418558 RepID=UPI003CEF5B31